ncbi:helix-turn-helix domain-containing protein [Bartonella sp. 220]|uniref:XRE family transcriptional regulator n=1 Tax=Bartonella sp. 220B TaxID=2967260 RepID=UPI0022A9AD8F|nr:XRE family transcriptional regulator [Bartonella sp. 220B]MCZ2158837.1 helix-turn-helix domain-containing protein [Bartonella sp. 220B]
MTKNIIATLQILQSEFGLNQKDLADRLNVTQATVSRWLGNESDPRGSHRDAILELYKSLKGYNQVTTLVPVMGYVGAGLEIDTDVEQIPEDGLETIEIPFDLPFEAIGFMVRGTSMFPVYKDGDLIVVKHLQTKPISDYYGDEVVVLTEDNRRFIKQIVRSSEGIVLKSWNADPIKNVKIKWIGEIVSILPRKAYRLFTK